MNTKIETAIAEFARTNKVSKAKTEEFARTLMSMKTGRVKKEKVVKESTKGQIGDSIRREVSRLTDAMEVFTTDEIAFNTGASVLYTRMVMRQLKSEGKIVVAGDGARISNKGRRPKAWMGVN